MAKKKKPIDDDNGLIIITAISFAFIHNIAVLRAGGICL